MKKGQEIGLAKGIKLTAKKMLELGIPVEQIIKVTGLRREEIEE